MPLLRRRVRRGRREEHVRVWRPHGTRYAEGAASFLPEAVQRACDAFRAEHGAGVVRDRAVVEAVGVTGGWRAAVFELPEGA